MKRMYQALSVLLLLVLLMSLGATAFAAETDTASETVYTLTYPDGSVVTTTDEAEAKRLEDTWKLLYSGKTDAEGKIILSDWAESGTIRIVEKQIPAGYTAITTTHETDLSSGKITIINKRVRPTTPKTGDEAQPVLYAVLAGASLALAGGAVILSRRLRNER